MESKVDSQTYQSTSLWDIPIIWAMTVLSHITASDVLVWVTLIYTTIKLILLIRDEFWSKP